MKKRIIAFSAAAVLWCGFIFYLSSENSEQSSERSGRVITALCRVMISDFDSYTEEHKQQVISDMSFTVRKLAHFTAYAVLGALLFQAFCFVRSKRIRSAAAIGGAAVYAATDEFHQSFIPGRSCELRDILIDTGGAALAVALTLLVMLIIARRKKIKNK